MEFSTFSPNVPYPPWSLEPDTLILEFLLLITSLPSPPFAVSMTRTFFLYSVIPALLPTAYRTTSSYRQVFLCPVRALRYYLQRTRTHRRAKRRLFISVNESYDRDIIKNTISRWIVTTIRQAYRSLDFQLPTASIMTHEVRAVSASLSPLYVVFSMVKIMEAAFWKNPATFIHFYLRDVRAHRQDGSYGIASMVLAQAASA